MPKPFDRVITRKQYDSAKHVHESADRNESLVAAVRRVSQKLAATDVAAASISSLTDNSGGTAGVVYATEDSGVLADNDLTGLTTGVTAASLNTAADTVMNAYATLVEQANLVIDEIWGTSADFEADEGPGTAGSGTIAVIDDSASANSNNTDAATTVSARAVQRDLLHAQATVIHLIDDLREAVGLARVVPQSLGFFNSGTAETLVFADADPDTITRDVGSFVADGFLPGDVIEVSGTADNNGTFTIATMTATVLTLAAADALTAESLDATETAVATVKTTKRNYLASKRLAGTSGAGPDLDETVTTDAVVAAGANWTFEFEGTGGTAISNAANGADATSAILLADWDAFVDQLADNVAFMADNLDAVTGLTAGALGHGAVSG